MRRRRSQWRSFLNGVVLATVPVVAFVATDYLLAPPSDGSADSSVARQGSAEIAATSRVQQFASRVEPARPETPITATAQATPPAPQPAVVPVKVEAGPSRNSLVAGIQEELKRVGCYSGAQDGVWNEQTKAAMVAFNGSVHVSLATDKPDYILLTLLQGHSAKACADKAIEARVTTPVAKAPRIAAVTAPNSTWTATVVDPKLAAPKVAVRPAARPVAIPGAAPAAVQAPAAVASQSPRYAEPQQAVAASEPDQISSTGEAMPGRMSVGVMPPMPRAEPVAPQQHAQAPARPKPASVTNSRPDTSSNWRSRTFSDLARSAP